jgi:hypothetical protein
MKTDKVPVFKTLQDWQEYAYPKMELEAMLKYIKEHPVDIDKAIEQFKDCKRTMAIERKSKEDSKRIGEVVKRTIVVKRGPHGKVLQVRTTEL